MTFGDSPLMTELGVYLPLLIAAVVVTTLNVEPGGYWPWVARLSWQAIWTHAGVGVGLLSLYDGLEYIARIGARPRIQRDDRAGAAGEPLLGDLLGLGVERRVDVVADGLVAAERPEDGVQAGLRGRQVLVAGDLQPGRVAGSRRSSSRPAGRTAGPADTCGPTRVLARRTDRARTVPLSARIRPRLIRSCGDHRRGC